MKIKSLFYKSVLRFDSTSSHSSEHLTSNSQAEIDGDPNLDFTAMDTNTNRETNAAMLSTQRSTSASQSTRQLSRSSRSSLGPVELLDRHIASIDRLGLYHIPEASHHTSTETFEVEHLQAPGLLNDGNHCSLLSILICFNRIGIKHHLIDPHFCLTSVQTPDYPSLVLHRVMCAMPSSAAFSIKLLIEIWNHSGRQPQIQPGFVDLSGPEVYIFQMEQVFSPNFFCAKATIET